MSAIDMWLKSRLYVLPLTSFYYGGFRLMINLYDVAVIEDRGDPCPIVTVGSKEYGVERDDLYKAFVAAYKSYNGQPDDSSDGDPDYSYRVPF